MNKNKICSIALTLCLGVTILNGYTCPANVATAKVKKASTASGFTFKKHKLPLTSEKEKYIIITKDKQKADTISEKYKMAKHSKFSKLAKAKNIVSLKISGKEANEILKDANVLCVEPDKSVTGCTETTPEQITEENQKTWNQKMLHVPETKEEGTAKIKVAILDSGIDYGNDIVYKEQINLIPGEEELTPFFTDATGHGTSVAGIIAAEDNEVGITGINPNVELYSAKVLTDGNKAPVSRVVEGIYWAIEKKVNIINMSFSTTDDSQILRKAVEDAYQAGILMIAAAGNNGQVEYPAAYPQVVAVGSVNAEGETAEKSASGEELELVAPGEKVTSTGLLHGTIVESGTSLAAPHVTGVASLLWQKDLSVSADFIRGLLNKSANPCGDTKEYGEGLIDYEYALSIYDAYKEDYEAGQDDGVGNIPENTNAVPVFEENNAVEGQWKDHAGKAKDAGATMAFQNGAAYPDASEKILAKLSLHHAWHGGRFSNFIADYCYLVNVAEAVGSLGGNATENDINNKINSIQKVAGMDSYIKGKKQINSSGYTDTNNIYNHMQEELRKFVTPKLKGLSKADKKAYVYGLASHIATDAYAHATYRYDGSWREINHEDDPERQVMYADTVNCVQRRFNSATQVLNKIISRYNGNTSTSAYRDFDLSTEYYNPAAIEYSWVSFNVNATYRMTNLRYYAKTAGETDSSILSKYNAVTVYDGASAN